MSKNHAKNERERETPRNGRDSHYDCSEKFKTGKGNVFTEEGALKFGNSFALRRPTNMMLFMEQEVVFCDMSK